MMFATSSVCTTCFSLVRFLFWHSLFFTISTPLTRVFTKKWLYTVTVPAAAGLEDATFEAYPPTHTLDRAWIPHALFGLLWLCAGSAQFLITPTMQKRAHKIGGYVALLVFVGHMAAAANNLIHNALDHTPVNKLLLLNDLTEGTIYIVIGMMEVFKRKEGWLQRHKDNMFLGFVTSIEGAGTIRTIAFIHYIMGKSGIDQDSFLWMISGADIQQCQAKYRTVGAICGRAYTMRMVWIRFLTNLYVTQYASFTPSVKQHATDRWTSWKIMIAILAFAGDQQIPEETAMTVFILNGAYRWGWMQKMWDMVGAVLWEVSAPSKKIKAKRVVEAKAVETKTVEKAVITKELQEARELAKETAEALAKAREQIAELEKQAAKATALLAATPKKPATPKRRRKMVTFALPDDEPDAVSPTPKRGILKRPTSTRSLMSRNEYETSRSEYEEETRPRILKRSSTEWNIRARKQQRFDISDEEDDPMMMSDDSDTESEDFVKPVLRKTKSVPARIWQQRKQFDDGFSKTESEEQDNISERTLRKLKTLPADMWKKLLEELDADEDADFAMSRSKRSRTVPTTGVHFNPSPVFVQ